MQKAGKAVALLAFGAAPLGATCAVAVWTPHRIVIGADSRETLIHPDRGTSSVTECKIRQVGPYFVVVAGVTHHPTSDFDVWRIIEGSIRGAGSLPEAAEVASKEIARRYAEVLRTARENGGERYAADLESNAPQFTMAGLSSGRPYLARYSYDRVRGVWMWNKLVYPGAGDAPGYVYLCNPRGIQMYQRLHRRWRSDDPVKTVAGMIEAAARLDRVEVGPPVAVLVLDQAGAHWRDPGTCR